MSLAVFNREDVDKPPYLSRMKIYCSACGTLIELDTAGEGSVLERLDQELRPQPSKRGYKFVRLGNSILYCPAKTVEERYLSRNIHGHARLSQLKKFLL